MKGSMWVDFSGSFAEEISLCAYRRGVGATNGKRYDRLRRETLRVMREELTDRQREMLMLYYLGGRNIPQLALQFGLNKSTVSRHISRAKHKIKQKVQKALDGGGAADADSDCGKKAVG
ncbi:MAG: RNA polymerase sigma factor [Acetanaerobacterium sp.]